MQSGVQQMGTDAGEDHSPPPLPGPMRCYRGLFFEGAWIRKILKTSTYVTQQIAVLFKASDWQDSGGERQRLTFIKGTTNAAKYFWGNPITKVTSQRSFFRAEGGSPCRQCPSPADLCLSPHIHPSHSGFHCTRHTFLSHSLSRGLLKPFPQWQGFCSAAMDRQHPGHNPSTPQSSSP